jgi:5-methylcytosine-specific restriction endonuclease McrA
MKPHTRLYLESMNYDLSDFVPCEICGSKAVDIHHIEARGLGGTKAKDTIENLMALCRKCHIDYGDKKHLIDFLKEIHNKKIVNK